MIEPAAVTAAAALRDPLLPAERRTALADAVVRTELGHARVLVLGEAKRGKSTLVNALFGAPLLPTGAAATHLGGHGRRGGSGPARAGAVARRARQGHSTRRSRGTRQREGQSAQPAAAGPGARDRPVQRPSVRHRGGGHPG